MKKLIYAIVAALLLCQTGCSTPSSQIVATTLPVYEFTSVLCQGTGLSVSQLVTESVSCLHDYTLQVSQMRMLENAQVTITSGAGLEDFLQDALSGAAHVIDASTDTHLHTGDHAHEGDHAAEHTYDPHIWLSPENATQMAKNISAGLTACYPEHAAAFTANLQTLLQQIEALDAYGQQTLSQLSCTELITFHDGFGYFAEHFGLHILRAVEEESGSEASAQELKELIQLTREHALPAIFTEKNGSTSAAGVISAETGVEVFALDMGLSGSSYFDAMYHNINIIKEALG